MSTTSLTLLDRLRQPDQPEAWGRFVRLYAPMILKWAKIQGLQEADAEDLAQTVLIKLLSLLPNYERRDGQTFRGWLFTICRNECINFRTRRATRPLPAPAGLSGLIDPVTAAGPDEAEYRRDLVRRGLELIRADFTAETWDVFTWYVVEGRPVADVARERGITASVVYSARHRVLTRLRAALADLLD